MPATAWLSGIHGPHQRRRFSESVDNVIQCQQFVDSWHYSRSLALLTFVIVLLCSGGCFLGVSALLHLLLPSTYGGVSFSNAFFLFKVLSHTDDPRWRYRTRRCKVNVHSIQSNTLRYTALCKTASRGSQLTDQPIICELAASALAHTQRELTHNNCQFYTLKPYSQGAHTITPTHHTRTHTTRHP